MLANVTVDLLDQHGSLIASTVSALNGSYSFNNLAAGCYTVRETDPSGYVSTTLNAVQVILGSGVTSIVDFGDVGSPGLSFADPAVTKFGDPASAEIGSIVTFIITVGNNGNSPTGEVILTDTKPAFLDVIAVNVSPRGFPVIITGSGFTINFGIVSPSDVYTVEVVTRVNSTLDNLQAG